MVVLFADMTITLHTSQVHCSGVMQWWAYSSLNLLLCLQRQVAKVANELFYYWPLLRNNNMATIFRRCTSSYGGRRFAACNYQCCQPCGFPANLGLFFVDLRVFWRLAGCLFFGLVFCRFLFCGLLFFKSYGTFALQFAAKGNSGVFLCKFAHFGLGFSDFPPGFCI